MKNYIFILLLSSLFVNCRIGSNLTDEQKRDSLNKSEFINEQFEQAKIQEFMFNFRR